MPLSANTTTGSHALVRGIDTGVLQVPLHRVHLSSDLVGCSVVVGVRPSLPVPGVDLVMGNDQAGTVVWEGPKVIPLPAPTESVKSSPVLPVCLCCF